MPDNPICPRCQQRRAIAHMNPGGWVCQACGPATVPPGLWDLIMRLVAQTLVEGVLDPAASIAAQEE